MSTTVVYANRGDYVRYGSDAVYLDVARGDASTNAVDDLGFVGQNKLSSLFSVWQSFIGWDTTAVGTDTVSAVDLEVSGTHDVSTDDFVIETYEYDWGGGTADTSDYRDSDTGIPALGSIIASYDTSGGWSTTAGYNNDLGANASFNSVINGAGDTRVVLLSQEHRVESEPSLAEYVRFDLDGATNDARLTITHAPGGHYVAPTDDVTTTGWTTTPLWSKVDEDPGSPDATVITATAS